MFHIGLRKALMHDTPRIYTHENNTQANTHTHAHAQSDSLPFVLRIMHTHTYTLTRLARTHLPPALVQSFNHILSFGVLLLCIRPLQLNQCLW